MVANQLILKETISCFLGGPNQSLNVLEESRDQCHGVAMRESLVESSLAIKRRKGPGAKECRWPLKAGKGKEMTSPLEPPEGMQPC